LYTTDNSLKKNKIAIKHFTILLQEVIPRVLRSSSSSGHTKILSGIESCRCTDTRLLCQMGGTTVTTQQGLLPIPLFSFEKKFKFEVISW